MLLSEGFDITFKKLDPILPNPKFPKGRGQGVRCVISYSEFVVRGAQLSITGEAFCGPGDKFCGVLGRKMAFARALHAMFPDRERHLSQRTKLWIAYMSKMRLYPKKRASSKKQNYGIFKTRETVYAELLRLRKLLKSFNGPTTDTITPTTDTVTVRESLTNHVHITNLNT